MPAEAVKLLSDRVKVGQIYRSLPAIIETYGEELTNSSRMVTPSPSLGLAFMRWVRKRLMRVLNGHYKLGISILILPSGTFLYLICVRSWSRRYENEAPCGKAINEYLGTWCHHAAYLSRKSLTGVEANKVPRETIFLTSKLKSLRSYSKTLSDLRASLKRTGVPYFDLYLLHSAIGGPEVRKECWRACVDAQKEGLVKSIGVSNWGTKHIQELLDAGSVLPVVNQIDLHPFMRHPDIVKICQDNGILLEVSLLWKIDWKSWRQAWGPLARAMRFDHPSIQKVAKAQGKSQAQIFLRWGLQHVRWHFAFPSLTELISRDTSSSPNQSRKRGSLVIPRSLTLSSLAKRWRRYVNIITGTRNGLTNSWTVWMNTSSPIGMLSIAHSSLKLAVVIAYMYTTKLNLSWQKVVRRLVS
jgi:diketogulonate reductase-like aldo/keto reductase